VTEYRLVAQPRANLDVAAAYRWYENERVALGLEFLDHLEATYDRITDDPFQYQELNSGIRRALLRRFPYAVAISTNRQSALIRRICSMVRARDSSSRGLAAIHARHIALETATLSRLREKRNSRLRGTSSALEVAIE